MRRFLIFAFATLFLFLGLLVDVKAQDAGVSAPSQTIIYPEPYPIPDQSPGFLGQNHNYSVVFRGNGEAVVSVRVVLLNKGDGPLGEVTLRVPKVEPQELAVYQIIRDKVCIRYGAQEYDSGARRYKPPVCEEYSEPDYYQVYGNAKYQKAEATYSGDTVRVVLPNPIGANKSGSYFVYFRAFSYAKKNIFGSYKFNFETLKVEDEIQSLGVGISTDSDLVLRGAKGEVQYRFEESSLKSLGAPGAGAVASPAIDRFVSQIGQGTISKTASNLAPLESYTVDGQYASSRLKLYAKEILIVVVVGVLLFGFLALIFWVVFKKLRKRQAVGREKEEGGKFSEKGPLVLLSLGLSFISSFAVVAYSVGIIFLSQSLERFVNYPYQIFVVFFLIIISFCIYFVLIFGPGIYFGYKQGIGWGIATVVMTIFWLFVYLTLGIVVLFLLGNKTQPIIPLLGGL